MATIKSYTDLEQSKKLAEILPIESADMYYFLDPTPAGNIYSIVIPQISFGVKTREPEYSKGDIPCWSLAALLGVLPEGIIESYYIPNLQKENGKYSIAYGSSDELLGTANNPIDACYEMILKLNELNLL